MDYSIKEIDLTQQALHNWDFVFCAYLRSHAAGIEAVAMMDAHCPLCSEFAKLMRGQHGYVQGCRRCPIVRTTGRSCQKLRASAGMSDNWKLHHAQAFFVITRAQKQLKKILEHMIRANMRAA